jgi:hypothetical protein
MYRAEATSMAGFVQQLAVSYLANGYLFYVHGRIPGDKDPDAVDAKLVDRYRIDISKWARVRRKRAGLANLHYLRFERTFLLLATHGRHRFFDEEKNAIRDARRVPIRFHGYSISFRGGHAHVRIAQDRFQELKSYFTALATRRPKQKLEEELGRIPFEPYAPVRRQLLIVLRAVNRARKRQGLEPVERTCFRFKRRIFRPFEKNPSVAAMAGEPEEGQELGRGITG